MKGRARRAPRAFSGAAMSFLAVTAVLFASAGCGPKPIFRGDRPASAGSGGSSRAESGDAGGGPVDPLTDALVAAAEPWLGTPYRYGGTTRRGVDCSALAVHLLDEVGIRLPRSVGSQRGIGREVPRDEIAAGDLVFFRLESRRVNHVGIALDGERFVHASRSRGVRIDRFDDDYFGKRIVETRRVAGEERQGNDPPASPHPVSPESEAP